jgi:hypothetical protein
MSRCLAVVSAFSIFGSGCSLLFMNKPHEPVAVPNYPVDCTSSRVAPGFDVAGVAYFVVNGIVILSRPDCPSSESCLDSGVKIGAALIDAALVGVYLASAISGFNSAERCEQIKDLNAQCITGNETACRKLNPSWVPTRVGGDRLAPAPPPTPGCFKDTDCKEDRICVSSTCVDPPKPAKPPAGETGEQLR